MVAKRAGRPWSGARWSSWGRRLRRTIRCGTGGTRGGRCSCTIWGGRSRRRGRCTGGGGEVFSTIPGVGGYSVVRQVYEVEVVAGGVEPAAVRSAAVIRALARRGQVRVVGTGQMVLAVVVPAGSTLEHDPAGRRLRPAWYRGWRCGTGGLGRRGRRRRTRGGGGEAGGVADAGAGGGGATRICVRCGRGSGGGGRIGTRSGRWRTGGRGGWRCGGGGRCGRVR